MPASATVVITTKNRKEELANAIRSALEQTAAPEVLVIDDGSTDGTSEFVRQTFPTVRLERSEQSLGLIAQRNRGAELAKGDVFFSIDDDAVFTTPHVVAQTLKEFDHPRVAAVAIPFIEPNKRNVEFQRAPDAKQIYVSDRYIGTAHALRRDVFLKLHGYRAYFIHQGEEGDYCIRMLNAGYVVRSGTSDPIHHFESPRRDFKRMDYYGRRNDILHTWCNVPMPYLLPHLVVTTFKGALFSFKVRRPRKMLAGLANGWLSIFTRWGDRHSVRPAIYRLSRRLRKRGATPLAEIEGDLPPVDATP